MKDSITSCDSFFPTGIAQKIGRKEGEAIVRLYLPGNRGIPPRVEYELTDLGHDVLVPVTALAEWALSQRERVEKARINFDRSAEQNVESPRGYKTVGLSR